MSSNKLKSVLKTRAELPGIILHIIEGEPIGDQNQLLNAIRAQGGDLTQATLSRWLHKLGVVKENGVYRVRQTVALPHVLPAPYRITLAPPNLMLVHTPPGYAVAVAATIDKLCTQEPLPKGLQGILGTVAGDDTVLVVTEERAHGGNLKAALLDFLITGLRPLHNETAA